MIVEVDFLGENMILLASDIVGGVGIFEICWISLGIEISFNSSVIVATPSESLEEEQEETEGDDSTEEWLDALLSRVLVTMLQSPGLF